MEKKSMESEKKKNTTRGFQKGYAGGPGRPKGKKDSLQEAEKVISGCLKSKDEKTRLKAAQVLIQLESSKPPVLQPLVSDSEMVGLRLYTKFELAFNGRTTCPFCGEELLDCGGFYKFPEDEEGEGGSTPGGGTGQPLST